MIIKERIEKQIKELDIRIQKLNKRREYCLQDAVEYGYCDPTYLNTIEQDLHVVEYARLVLLDVLKDC